MLEFIVFGGLAVSLLGLIYMCAKYHFDCRKLYLREVEAFELIAKELFEILKTNRNVE